MDKFNIPGENNTDNSPDFSAYFWKTKLRINSLWDIKGAVK